MLVIDGYATLGPKGGISGLKSGKARWNLGYGSVYVRKAKGGPERFYIDYRDGEGKRVQKVVRQAQNFSQAAQVLQVLVRDMLMNSYGLDQPKEDMSFRELADLFIENHSKVTKKSWKSDSSYVKPLKQFFCDETLRKIRQFEVESYVAARVKEGLKKSSVNRELACLKKMFNKAKDWGYMLSNPAEKVRFFSEKDNFKERILTTEEEQLLVENSPIYLRKMITTALHTGMRRAELLTLIWSNVDLEKKLVRLEHTKSGKIRFIPISPELHSLLSELKASTLSSPYVFVNGKTGTLFRDIKRSFQTACKRAGINSLRFHDLRHTFASRLVERGVDIITVKELLGHSTIRMTERYTHSHMDLKRKAVGCLGTSPKDFGQDKAPLLQDCDTVAKSGEIPLLKSMFSVN
jgi:integrase